MRLGDYQIRLQFTNLFDVDAVQRLARAQTAANFGIDGAARNGNVEGGLSARREIPHPAGVIAFMRPSHQHFTSAQRADDLGCAREQRNNAHVR